jgi:hypothetical protein
MSLWRKAACTCQTAATHSAAVSCHSCCRAWRTANLCNVLVDRLLDTDVLGGEGAEEEAAAAAGQHLLPAAAAGQQAGRLSSLQ